MFFLLNTILSIVEIIMLICGTFAIIVFTFEDLAGPIITDKVLSYLPFQITYDQIWIVFIVCLVIGLVCSFLRRKLP